MKRLVFLMTIAAGLAFLAQSARADDYALSIKNQSFTPQTLIIPANQKVKIIVKNLDTTPAEFESSDLDREKVVTAGGQIFTSGLWTRAVTNFSMTFIVNPPEPSSLNNL